MRTAALFAIAVLFASAVRAAAPSPEDWYTPESYADNGNTAELYYGYDSKADPPWKSTLVALDEEGNIIVADDMDATIQKNYVLKTALEAIQMSLKNTKQIQTLGKNLNDLLILGGIMIADNAGGGSYTVRFGDGTKSIKDVIAAKDGKGNVPATSDRKLADGFTLDWRVDNVNGTEVRSLQLKGAGDAISVDDYKSQWFRLGDDAHYLPFLRWGSNPGAGELIWTNFGGFDNTAFGEVPTADQGTHGVPLTLKGWYTNDFEHTTVTRLMTEDDDDAKDLRKKLQILARKTISDQSSAPDHLTYIPIGDVISGLGLPPDDVSVESYVTEGSTNLAIKGWHTAAAKDGVDLAALMSKAKPEGGAETPPDYTVPLRFHDATTGSNILVYAKLGDIHKMSWSTNWYNAVKDIAEDQATKIVNWNTNWVYLANSIASSKEETKKFVQTVTNVYYNVLKELSNWTVITNVFVTYMGGGLPSGTGGGGGGDKPLTLDPKKDPYTEEFEKEELTFDYLLPVKNGWMIRQMTNDLWDVVNVEHALDFASLYTNDEHRAEISGFHLAETNQLPIKAEIAPGIYGVDWVDYPEELVKMTSGNIKQIFRWWQQHSGVTNLLANIITNHEALAEMKTNLWSRVKVETLLDNQSVWTNGVRQIEVKGYENAGVCAVPYKHYPTSEDPEGSTTEIRWADVPQGSAGPNFDSTLLSNGIEMKWGRAAPAIKFVGTDTNNFAVVGEGANTNTVTFASAADSNVRVHVAEDQDDPGSVTITIGVYYLSESALTPPVVE